MREAVFVPNAPRPVAPLSPAIRAGEFVFVSGQLPLEPTGQLAEGMSAQTRQCLENLKQILSAAGLSMDNVVKCTVFITDMDEFDTMNRAYAEYFPETPPARSTVEVSRLAKGALVEIEAIALR